MEHHKANQYTLLKSQKEQRKKKYWEIWFQETMWEKFPNLGTKINVQIHEVQKPPNREKLKKSTQIHYNQMVNSHG